MFRCRSTYSPLARSTAEKGFMFYAALSNLGWQRDGLRPTCSNCFDQATSCTYRDDVGLSSESKRVVVDVLEMLNSLPAPDGNRVLASLKSEKNASVIISTRRDETNPKNRADTTLNETKNAASLFEFERQNPIAYPSLFDPEETAKQLHLNSGLYS